ncbi:hypothetical protein CVT25_001914 [Psilocybe cyanescens]|uniref:N-acetyltransferase domain-containing protein n=1 Tax=Psilocybe cyanescens TaxID=93625 RepID=A0A409WQK1_PSICY|nr:hypothetical protein CVT25_001914 [Psilocybe cyanescens]
MFNQEQKNPGQSVRMDKISVEQTLGLRHSVLWPDMPLSQVCLPEDSAGIHFGALLPHSDEPIAVISLFVEALPIDKNTTSDLPLLKQQNQQHQQNYGYTEDETTETKRALAVVRFRKFACAPRYQGKGIGTHLLAYALSIARSELDAGMAWCDARTTSTEWYEKRSLQTFGETFFKGPVEYVRMWIDLRDSPGSEHPTKERAFVPVTAEADSRNLSSRLPPVSK